MVILLSSEIKRIQCLEKVNYIEYSAQPNILTSGRYIRSLRYLQELSTKSFEKEKYEGAINRQLNDHLILLQEALLNGTRKKQKYITLSNPLAETLKNLLTSEYTVNDGSLTLINTQDLKKLQIVKRAVMLDSPLVLSFKVKSDNQQYNFNTQIFVTPDNVLTYTRGELEYDYTPNINHNTLINKLGTGLKNNELIIKMKGEGNND